MNIWGFLQVFFALCPFLEFTYLSTLSKSALVKPNITVFPNLMNTSTCQYSPVKADSLELHTLRPHFQYHYQKLVLNIPSDFNPGSHWKCNYEIVLKRHFGIALSILPPKKIVRTLFISSSSLFPITVIYSRNLLVSSFLVIFRSSFYV